MNLGQIQEAGGTIWLVQSKGAKESILPPSGAQGTKLALQKAGDEKKKG